MVLVRKTGLRYGAGTDALRMKGVSPPPRKIIDHPSNNDDDYDDDDDVD